MRGRVPLVWPLFASKRAVCVNQKAVESFEVRDICLPKTYTDPNTRLEKRGGLNSLRC